jgi:lipoic acid synthetase
MLGLGETEQEIRQTICDLKQVGKISILTVGQYLRPTAGHLEIERYYSPEEFASWKKYAEAIGIASVASGPMVRSSYHADEAAAVMEGIFLKEVKLNQESVELF